MDYNAKSVIIGNKKRGKDYDMDSPTRPIFISLFDENNPHLSGVLPKKRLDFEKVRKVEFIGLKLEYYCLGSDLVINNLKSVSIEEKGDMILIKGVQLKE